MERINSILNDESNNDKQLIKELSILIKNNRDKKIPIDKHFVQNIIDIVARNSEFDYKEIEFVNNYFFNASWNDEIMRLRFDMTSVLHYIKQIKYYTLHSKIGDNRVLKYYVILAIIIHEFTHARQLYVRKEDGNEIYDSCNDFVDKKNEVYLENHDETLIERYATLRGYTIAYEVLSYIYSLNQIQELRRVIYIYLLYGYKMNCDGDTVQLGFEGKLNKHFEIISAIDTYNAILEENDLSKIDIDSCEDMTLYERFYLGLPISPSEYRQLKNLYCDIYYNEENESVKKLINRL